MTGAIWILLYDIDPNGRERYLDWFHGTHIPEKLARPGYDWAGHYQMIDGDRYVALFGGASTRVFFDPSPAQLKQTQDDLTREMIGLRQNPAGLIFSEEWDCEGPDVDARPGQALELLIGDAEDDDAFNVWLAQAMMPAFAKHPGAVRGRKLLSVLGAGKHGVLTQFASVDTLNAFEVACPFRFTPATGTPIAGRRIWPPTEDDA